MGILALLVGSGLLMRQSMRYAQYRGTELASLSGVAFLTAAIVYVTMSMATDRLSVKSLPLLIPIGGFVNGLFYVCHMIVALRCFTLVGVGIPSALTSAGIILTIVVSWLIWHEEISVLQWTAIGLTPLAMILVQPQRPGRGPDGWKSRTLLVLNFALAGHIMLVHKVVSLAAAKDTIVVYQASLFLSATLFSTGYLAHERPQVNKGDLVPGVVVGVFVAANTGLLLPALRSMSTVVVLLSTQCGLVILNLLLDPIIWDCHLQHRQTIGVSLAVAIILLSLLG